MSYRHTGKYYNKVKQLTAVSEGCAILVAKESILEQLSGWIAEDDILLNKPVAPHSPRMRAVTTTDHDCIGTDGVGMYGETPRVRVGQFSICRQDDNSVWIERESEEGAQFPDDLFEDALKSFWKKHA